MASSTSRSSQGWDGSISSARSSRSGCAADPAHRRARSAARSSRSHPRSGCPSMPTVRSPDSSRSPCAVAQARCACTDELPSHVDPGPDVDAYARERAGDFPLAQRDEKLLWAREGGDIHISAADLHTTMRIAADTPGKIVRARELESLHVARRGDLARVEDLDDVDRGREPFEHAPPQMSSAVAAEGVRNIRQPALLVDHRDRLLGAMARRNTALEVQADHFAIGGGDLFPDDHLQTRVHVTEAHTALDGVVVG